MTNVDGELHELSLLEQRQIPASYECGACRRRVAAKVNRCPSCGTLGEMAPSSKPPELHARRLRPQGMGRSPSASIVKLPSARASSLVSLGARVLSSSFDELAEPKTPRGRLLAKIPFEQRERYATGIEPIDLAMGGRKRPGVVHGSISGFGGPPGTWKSSFLMLTLAAIADRHRVRVGMLTAGEMSPALCAEYADRLELWTRYPKARELFLFEPVTSISDSVEIVDELELDVYGLDSAHGLIDDPYDVRGLVACAAAHERRCEHSPELPTRTGILVAHGTKDGDMAGPLRMKHKLDTLIVFEFFDEVTGEALEPKYAQDAVRLLREKNRFAPSGLAGAFRLDEELGPTPLPLAEKARARGRAKPALELVRTLKEGARKC
jgi:predicted ATP-dependent serine protease